MNKKELNKQFFNFLRKSPTPYHATQNMSVLFSKAGFIQLMENEIWDLLEGQSYFILRDDGALIAFQFNSFDSLDNGLRLLGAHTDSPCLKIKPNPDRNRDSYHQLGVEVYGGALLHPWFDRDLSLAGRVSCQLEDETLQSFLVNFKKPLLVIPSLAIHLNRDANTRSNPNAQLHLPPILSQELSTKKTTFSTLLLNQLHKEYNDKKIKELLGFDIFCYETQPPSLVGSNKEFICSSKLDNLLSCFVGMRAMLDSKNCHNAIFICNNHEEIGSSSSSGALGSFVHSFIERILPNAQRREICLSNSFLISLDNAHAFHPNYGDKSDVDHVVVLNKGPVIKTNANQKYATSSHSMAKFKILAKEAKVPVQEFVMRSDMACGSTIGPLTATRIGVETIDVGAPSLAMHSIRETTGSDDPHLLYKVILNYLSRATLPI